MKRNMWISTDFNNYNNKNGKNKSPATPAQDIEKMVVDFINQSHRANNNNNGYITVEERKKLATKQKRMMSRIIKIAATSAGAAAVAIAFQKHPELRTMFRGALSMVSGYIPNNVKKTLKETVSKIPGVSSWFSIPGFLKTATATSAETPKKRVVKPKRGRKTRFGFFGPGDSNNMTEEVSTLPASKVKVVKNLAKSLAWSYFMPHRWSWFAPFKLAFRGGVYVVQLFNPKTNKYVEIPLKTREQIRQLLKELPPEVASELVKQLRDLQMEKKGA